MRHFIPPQLITLIIKVFLSVILKNAINPNQGGFKMADCIFCKIAAGEIPSQIVYEDAQVVAFKDLSPKAPVHVLIVPKKHVQSVAHFQAEDKELAAHIFVDVVPKLAAELGVAEGGFRLVLNTGDDGGQTVHHLHVHLLGGRKMTWPPG